MNRTAIALSALLLGAASTAQGQQATEPPIPLGQLPGMSGKTTLMGTVGSVNGSDRSLAVQSAAGSQAVKTTPATRIWFDHSAAGQPPVAATIADLRPGQRIEVKFTDPSQRTTADRIKVAAATPP